MLPTKNKYINVKIIDNGGWHFSNMKTAKGLEHKYKSYMHHREFDMVPLSVDQIDKLVQNKKAIYDLKVDKRNNKIGDGSKLENYSLDKLPKFLQNNIEKFKDWID